MGFRQGSPHLDWLSAQDEERLGTLRQEAGELVYEDMLDLVGLLYSDANPHAVDAGLDEDFLVFVARDGERVQEDFWGTGSFNLGDIVPFRGLRCEIGDGQRRSQR